MIGLLIVVVSLTLTYPLLKYLRSPVLIGAGSGFCFHLNAQGVKQQKQGFWEGGLPLDTAALAAEPASQ